MGRRASRPFALTLRSKEAYPVTPRPVHVRSQDAVEALRRRGAPSRQVAMVPVNGGRKPISVLIAVAVRLYRDGLGETLGAHPSLDVVGAFGTCRESLAAVSDLLPDVVIVDVSLDGALSLMQAVRQESQASSVLAFAVRDDIAAVLECADAGADGFFTANGSVPELVEAIERTAAGELLCSPRLAAQLLRRAARRMQSADEVGSGHDLTVREHQVFSLVRQGRSNKEIASALHLSEATVKNHVHHLLQKLRVASRAQAITSCLQPLEAPPGLGSPSRPRGDESALVVKDP